MVKNTSENVRKEHVMLRVTQIESKKGWVFFFLKYSLVFIKADIQVPIFLGDGNLR